MTAVPAKVLIRADASLAIGTGHVMRCLALAEELKRSGAEVTFASRVLEGDLLAFTEARGFRVHRLRGVGAALVDDAEQCLAALAGARVDVLIVDHYGLGARWEERLRPVAGRILVIDDLADRDHLCDFLLDPSLGDASRYDSRVPAGCVRMIGPRFALLREEFASERAKAAPRGGSVKRIFVSFGGVDASNESLKAIRAFERLGGSLGSGVELDVVIGSTHPHRAELQGLHVAGVRCHVAPGRISTLMREADLAIGSGGTVAWERAALGLPSLVLSVAANQEESATSLGLQGHHWYLGPARECGVEMLATALAAACASPTLLRHLSVSSMKLVDAGGCGRVGRLLFPPEVALRRAERSDCDLAHEWRNAPETRRHFHDPSPVALDRHRRWFEDSLANPARRLWIADHRGKPVGVLRYDLSGSQALVSLYLAPGLGNRGLGAAILRAGGEKLRRENPEIARIQAEVRLDNQASLGAFLNAGYRENHVVLTQELES